MMTDFSRLSANWSKWSTMTGLRGASVSTDCEDCDILFASDDDSIHLRHNGAWWAIDSVNDRGRRYNDIALLSTFDLVEKFLIWRWGSLARTVIGARQLGAELHSQGPMAAVEFAKTSRDHYVELRTPGGTAVVSEASATVFSHVMGMSVEEIERLLTQDIE
jgi:hypothetical protein